jgi:hypothetical protein
MLTMCVWCIRASARSSRRKRATASGVSRSGRMVFTATCRFNSSSHASYTRPMPPAPMRRTTRNSPNRSGNGSSVSTSRRPNIGSYRRPRPESRQSRMTFAIARQDGVLVVRRLVVLLELEKDCLVGPERMTALSWC